MTGEGLKPLVETAGLDREATKARPEGRPKSEGMTAPLSPTDLEALAERCEQASGPDRELDIAILTTVLGYRDVHGDGNLFDRGNDGYWFVDDCSIHQLPSPTASLDAAMTLVPEPHKWSITAAHGDDRWQAWVWSINYGPNWYEAATPALALTAAALRAHSLAHQEGL